MEKNRHSIGEGALRSGDSTAYDGDRGATLVEMSFVLVVFMGAVVFTLWLLYYCWLANSLDFCLIDSARWAKLGQTKPGMGREASIVAHFEAAMNEYRVSPEAYTLRICPIDNLNCTTNSAGKLGEGFMIEAKRTPLKFMRLYSLPLKARMVVQNEPQ